MAGGVTAACLCEPLLQDTQSNYLELVLEALDIWQLPVSRTPHVHGLRQQQVVGSSSTHAYGSAHAWQYRLRKNIALAVGAAQARHVDAQSTCSTILPATGTPAPEGRQLLYTWKGHCLLCSPDRRILQPQMPPESHYSTRSFGLDQAQAPLCLPDGACAAAVVVDKLL